MNEEEKRVDETAADDRVLPEGVSRAELKRVDGMSRLFDFVEMLVLTVAAIMLLSTFFIRHTVVNGSSMDNTLHENQHLLISDVNYKPERGDIVVFIPLNNPDRSTPYVKRVIATEGQTVEIKNGVVLVDDIAVTNETYVSSNLHDNYPLPMSAERPVRVPEGYVFVLGDNRANSHDSRVENVGMVDVRSILGKVVCRVWPISAAGRVE